MSFSMTSRWIDRWNKITDKLSIVCSGGDGMKHFPGSSGRVFSALGRNGVNVVAIAARFKVSAISQPVIEQTDVAKAPQCVAWNIFLSDKKWRMFSWWARVWLGALCWFQVNEQFDKLSRENRLGNKSDGRGQQVQKCCLPITVWIFLALWIWWRIQAKPWIFRHYSAHDSNEFANSIFVDCTSSEAVADQYATILDANVSIVTPNESELIIAVALQTVERNGE